MLLLPLLLLALVSAARSIVLPPPAPGDNPAAMVLVQGADVYPEQYKELGLAIQNATDSPLWVGIAEGFLNNFPNPLQISAVISTVMQDLKEAGMPEEVDVFIAAHSLGGVVVQGYVVSNAASLRGLMLFGSYLTNRPLAEFPLPVLHLSGTLDGGQARPTRMADTYAELMAMEPEHDWAPLLKPVILLEGVDHAHFFTGDIPPSVAEHDILSELDADAARQMLAGRCAAFVALVQNRTLAEDSRTMLRTDYNATGAFLAPLYELQRQEADGERSEWAATAQRYLLNVANESVTVAIESSHEPDLSTLEHQHTTVNATGDTSANISIFSSVEHPLDPVDASPNSHTSSEIAVKMVSQELVASVLPAGTFGPRRSCRDANQLALDTALAAAPDTARERFSRRGHPAVLLDDHMALIGPLWVQERLRLTYGTDGVQVQSVAIETAVDSPFFPGNHYCKLLSPSRALEYVLIDGLRGTQP
ncbi:uncharacterized protein LOC119092739 [Pollicipes pollicipes]|uniref:uncharacterized protein LOC119092739 n=1 Tax=Pollicipes pollicipes TaxID=41117 RepID=UPI0018850023|nr:uncharacterized protein LOC119092739 [Pollicipes pollicipes]